MFALGLMAVNPALHDLAHGHASDDAPACCARHQHPEKSAPDQPEEDLLCAVVLYAQGVTFAVETVAPSTRPAVWHEAVFFAAEETLLAAPRYLHKPGRGPPVA